MSIGRPSPRMMIVVAVLCAGIGGILYGYDIGVISGALLFIRKTIPMTDTQTGIIVGAVLGGGLIGTLIAGPLADKFGRRMVILGSCLVFFVGIFAILFANTFLWILLARICLGVGVGLVAVAVPLYLTELVPAKIRGKCVGMFQLFLTSGILLAYLVDLYFTKTGNWRAMFAVLFIPVSLLTLGMLYLPETPRWLAAKQRFAQAKQVLSKFRASAAVEPEYTEIINSFHHEHGSWRELFSKQWLLPLFIAGSIAALNQLTGINLFFQYAPLILKQAGFTSNTVTMVGTVGMGLVNFIATALALLLVDRLGRRILLIAGTGGIVICQAALGIMSHSGAATQTHALWMLTFLLIYIVAFAVGPGVVVWLAISELLPTKLRGKTVAFCLFINSLTATLLASIFLDLVHWVSLSVTYWLFAMFTSLYFIISIFLLPETKGKSLEEVQKIFEHDATTSALDQQTPSFG